MDLDAKLEELKKAGEAPEWMTDIAFANLSKGYLLKDETPKQMFLRVSSTAADYLCNPYWKDVFFDVMWRNWLCLATPVISNMGTNRGLPISCFGSYVEDSVLGIMDEARETAVLSKNGGGTSSYMGGVRPRGALIKGGANGRSEGKIPFLKINDSTILAMNQGSTRRGAKAVYIDIEDADFYEFVRARRPSGDINRQCLNIHQGICVGDAFMKRMLEGDEEARKRWKLLLQTRWETGEPYVFFKDNVNRDNPPEYAKHGLEVLASNLCTEIMLASNSMYTFVCCLSSLNAARFAEWKDWKNEEGYTLPFIATVFLDAVMSEFIEKAEKITGMEKAVKFAKDSRALGLGVLGFHSLLQKEMLPVDHFQSYMMNAQIFGFMDKESRKASQFLAENYGEPTIMKGSGYRNSHRMAVAPTVSNSLNAGNYSPGIECWNSNYFAQGSAKGTFMRKNPELEKLLVERGKNTIDVWKSINDNRGSVQHLTFMTPEEREVFMTAREVNQFALLKLAAQRQKFIDQGQSLNLFYELPPNREKFPDENAQWAKIFHRHHVVAWESGLKALYYCRGKSVLKGDTASKETERASLKVIQRNDENECAACDG